MKNPDLTCNDERRRFEVRKNKHLNGLDYVEVSDDQLHISLYFLDKAPDWLRPENFRIDGGVRIHGVEVIAIHGHCSDDPERDDCLTITVNKPGDFSTYTLRLVKAKDGRPTDEPLDGFDVRYAQIDFSFKVNCPSDLDCKQQSVCPPEPLEQIEINYLAKDYGSFRQLILDRLALVMPGWQERHAADIGIALVEVLAYVGDHLSYYQDAVATESYIDTARLRVSVRRHARLVDYFMHEGSNARAWVSVKTSSDVPGENEIGFDPASFYFITGYKGALSDKGGIVTEDELRDVARKRYEVFEPMGSEQIRFYKAHNKIKFYTWGDRQCCLPKGATAATLFDEWVKDDKDDNPQNGDYENYEQADIKQSKDNDYKKPSHDHKDKRKTKLRNLKAGDVLILEEVKGSRTGDSADRDPNNRHAVRLTKVSFVVDRLYNQPVVNIEWGEEDALPFPLCISSIGPAPECALVKDVSVARGNVILADHGGTVPVENLGTVPEAAAVSHCESEGWASDIEKLAGVFRPTLKRAPLTFSQSLPPGGSASLLLLQDPHQAMPQVRLTNTQPEKNKPFDSHWTAQRDLLGSGRDDKDFVIEVDDDRRSHLRFGDGELGLMPSSGSQFWAKYRIGNGTAGNVGAGAIKHIVFRDSTLSGVELEPRNPLPATGGVEPEPVGEVRMFAPTAFRKQLQRAVIADDYSKLASQNPKVQRAAAQLLWNGSWYEAVVAIDPAHKRVANKRLLKEVTRSLYRYRRIGHDLKVTRAEYVPLDIAMTVCVLPGFLRGHVKARLLELFGNAALADGSLGYFHPDNLTFRDGIALSKLVALVQSVEGVETVRVNKLERLFEGPNNEIADGILRLGAMEIARLDNDPNFPENGSLQLEMRGGR